MATIPGADALGYWLEYGIDLKNRRISLHRGIATSEEMEDSSQGIEHVLRAIQFMDSTQGTIELWVSSPGGDICEALAIYDAIRACNNTVQTVGTGCIASAAVMILAGGHERYATPHAWFMSHASSTELALTLKDAETRIKWEGRLDDQFNTLMATHSTQSASWWKQSYKKGEIWWDAADMLENGIIDHIWPEPDDD